jgi:tetratricopeptide (TPR) repeat protein
LRSKGDLASAGEDYGQAIRLAPDNAAGFGGRGRIRLFTHDFSGAVADFDTALKLNPNDVNSHINRGAALSLLGENLRALSDFDKVIALEPQNPLAYVERGQAMHTLGDNAGAFAAVNVALKLVPKFPPALDALKTIGTPKNTAQILAALGRPVSAGECMMPVADVRLDPKSVERLLAACTGLVNSPGGSAEDRGLAFMQRGSMYRRLEKYDQALADFDQALRYDPNSASAHTGRGNALRHLGRFDESVAAHSEAIRLEPNNAMAYSNRGNAFDDKKDYEHAIAVFRCGDQARPALRDRVLQSRQRQAQCWRQAGPDRRLSRGHGASPRLQGSRRHAQGAWREVIGNPALRRLFQRRRLPRVIRRSFSLATLPSPRRARAYRRRR